MDVVFWVVPADFNGVSEVSNTIDGENGFSDELTNWNNFVVGPFFNQRINIKSIWAINYSTSPIFKLITVCKIWIKISFISTFLLQDFPTNITSL